MFVFIELFKNISFGAVNLAITSGFNDFGNMLESKHVRLLTTGKRSGRLYGSHRASAPNEYPAKMTGFLASSVGSKLSGKEFRFGEEAPYAKYLEYGTQKMAPRAHVKPSVENNLMVLGQFFNKHLKSKVFL